MTILFATSNAHKLSEVRTLLAEFGLHDQIITPGQLPVAPDHEPEETGDTYAANAALKVNFLSSYYDGWIMSDDSGIDVAALPGLFGVHSKRWHPGTDADRCQALLAKLATATNRDASYTCVCCLREPTGRVHTFTGVLPGTIAPTCRGQAGFGYDPLFIPTGYNQTLGELGQDVKNQLSHRRRAFQALAKWRRAHPSV